MSRLFEDPHASYLELMRRNFLLFLMRAFPHIKGGQLLAPICFARLSKFRLSSAPIFP